MQRNSEIRRLFIFIRLFFRADNIGNVGGQPLRVRMIVCYRLSGDTRSLIRDSVEVYLALATCRLRLAAMQQKWVKSQHRGSSSVVSFICSNVLPFVSQTESHTKGSEIAAATA